MDVFDFHARHLSAAPAMPALFHTLYIIGNLTARASKRKKKPRAPPEPGRGVLQQTCITLVARFIAALAQHPGCIYFCF
jgi:hypothetical protein